MEQQVIEVAILFVLAALCVVAILRLTEFRQEKRLEEEARKLTKAEGLNPRADGQLRRINRQGNALNGENWKSTIKRYVERLKTRRDLIIAANKRFGAYILWAFVGFVSVLLVSSSLLVVFAEVVFGKATLATAIQIIPANFLKLFANYISFCPTPPDISGGNIVSLLSVFHKFAITTVFSGLLPFLLIFLRRPSIFGESLKEAEAHLKVFGSGGEEGYINLRDQIMRELDPDEQQEVSNFRQGTEGLEHAD